jgi:hypothetical protein
MKIDEFVKLDRGDLVRHKLESKAYIVDANYGSMVVGIHSVTITNPDEWDLISKANYKAPSSIEDGFKFSPPNLKEIDYEPIDGNT